MNKIKLIVVCFSIILLGGNLVQSSYAESPKSISGDIKNEIKEIRKEEKEDRKDLKTRISNLKNLLVKKSAKLVNAQVSAINGAVLTVTKDEKTYTVNTDSKTKFIRHFWGKSGLSEISVGNEINVWGTWTNTDNTVIEARLIRNLSIMKRFGTFFGEVSAVLSDHINIKTEKRGDLEVYFTGSTKFTNRKEELITLADIKVGDKIRVKGLWDKILNKITESTQIKNFSLPAK